MNGKHIGGLVLAYLVVGVIVWRATNSSTPADTSAMGILTWPKQLLG